MTESIEPRQPRATWLAAEFERHRGHLRGVAYRMLGSVTEADDAVQEAWLRLARRDPGGTDDLRGWLTITVGRIALDQLRARRSRRETYAGTWLPEPIVTGPAGDARSAPGPEADAVLADQVGLALLVVLETLSPAERLAFVLHDVFGVSFDEIAALVERSPAAARQLASRARRRVRAEAPDPNADLAVQRRVIDAFLAAARAGDFEGLVRVLDPGVVFRADGGGSGFLARPSIRGAEEVARQAGIFGRRFAAYARPALVNGSAGVVVEPPGLPRIVAAFTIRAGRIAAIAMNGDPAKTTRIELD
jgi:RNA polymerase sigma-70 factor (ECF subfamily)